MTRTDPATRLETDPATTPREALGARFAHLFAFSGLSNLADGILLVGIPLYALTLTSSPGQISLLTAALTAPWLLFGLVAGLLIDRHDRVRILVVATCVRIAVFGGAALAAAAGALTMPVLLALLLVLCTAEVFADGSSSALVPDVTPRTRLAAANSRL
ncbi:MAG: MFS transporter, partial [Actinomycetales bacterium]|nr:MFS transporter [Actinomycetales bacterium]